MYLQVQVPIPIYESTSQSAIISCHLTKTLKNIYRIHCDSTYMVSTTELVLV